MTSTRAAEAQEIGVGTHVGRYVILRPLGEGAKGLMFVAHDPQLDREVALKLLRPRKDDGDQGGQQWLLEEAQALARLSHPNVVDVYDVGTWEDRVYVALEYVEGQTLDRWRESASRSVGDIVDVYVQAAQGLAAAHAAGIVHMDFKPSNVIVAGTSTVRVLDFALARRRFATASRDTNASSTDKDALPVVGTPGYISPESYLGSDPEPAADQFSFCVSLWETLHGERPFEGQGHRQHRDAVLRGDPRPPRNRIPRRLDAILRRGLRPDPERRFESMELLEAALQRTRDRRSLWLLTAVAMPVVALGGYAYARGSADDPPVCHSGPERFADAWSDSDRRSIEARFGASGELYAPRARDVVTSGLDEYRDTWISSYTEACRATRVLAEQSEELLDLRIACLEERRLAAAALVDVLTDGDPAVLEQAPAAVERLPGLEGCSDRQSLLRRTATPRDDRERARFDAMARELAAVEALALTEDLDGAMNRARAVLAEAEALAAGEHQARAHLALAGFWERRGDIDQAIAEADEAWFVADAAGADDERVDAALALVWFHGHSKAQYERSRWFGDLARRVLERLDNPSAQELVLLENQAGVAVDEGRYEDAIDTYEAVVSRTEGQVSYGQSARLASLAGAHFNLGHYSEAEALYLRALKMRTDVLGAQHPYVGDLLCNLAMTRHVLGQSERAIEDMRRGVALVENAKGPTENALRVIHNNFAVVLRDLGHHDEAAGYYRKSLEGWRQFEPGHPLAGALSANLADLEVERGHFDVAERHARESLEVLRSTDLPEDHPYFAFASMALGRALLGRGEPDEALTHLERAAALLDPERSDPLAVRDAHAALADALTATGGSPESIQQHRTVAEQADQRAGSRAQP